MQWEKPSYIVVNMSAEIGSYQDDLGRTADTPDGARSMLEGEPRDQPIGIEQTPAGVQPCESMS